jgi:ribonuclease HII
MQQRALVRGDARVGSIAAASIVAKVWRDARMTELDREFPGYGFARNAGYATAEHRRALRERGPSPVHRRSFAPVADAHGPCRTR